MREALERLRAIAWKEFIQMRRDRLTFAMIVGLPLIQLVLFGYAVNGDPRALPTALVCYDEGPMTRALVSAVARTGYFAFTGAGTAREAEAALAAGEVQFVLTVPPRFERSVVRGERPALVLDADATDPTATGGAIAAALALGPKAIDPTAPGLPAGAFEWRVHRRYNPEGRTQDNVVPGLLGVLLTMTMTLMTALAITRERERGTFETLLATPARPLEVMIGKIAPYVLVGGIQVALLLAAAHLLFGIPLAFDWGLFLAGTLAFIAANLALGLLFSTIAKNQMQAMQMTFFVFLPSILLSGFMFPFRGLPGWAQAIGSLLPITHYLRVVRGLMLKGGSWPSLGAEVLPILAFLGMVLLVGARRYRRTLD